MALNKYFVILFLVYLNFDISPLNSAAIPERPDAPVNVQETDDTTIANTEIDSTTGATDDDIDKIFESYENLYIKNSNWFNDDEVVRNLKSEKSAEIKPEEESTVGDFTTTEPTADDVVESIHNIMDEKIDAKKNRTDRTIVVVVTTNVFNINGSDDASKRQHTLLSFGTPGMIQKETSTDATLAMHNKITTEFFNSNPSPINEKSATSNENEKSLVANSDTIDSDDSEIPLPVTEDEVFLEVSTTRVTTEKPRDDDVYDKMDIRQFHDSADYRSSNDDSNDILRIMKIIPSRSVDESISVGLSKPFEIPIEESPDSSLMEAMENILDTDVRKAFERDIPQTRHVPLDINIEEEALYAPLKDLSEYIVEEVPINVNYDIFKVFAKTDDKLETVERDEPFAKLKELRSHLNNNPRNDFTERVDKSIDEPVTEQHTTDAPTTTTTTKIEAITTTATEEATTTATKEATTTTSAVESSANQQIDDRAESEESMTTTTPNDFNSKNSHHIFEEPTTEKEIQVMRQTNEIFGEEIPERQSEHDEVSSREDLAETEPFEENETKFEEEEEEQKELVAESLPSTEADSQLEHTSGDRIQSSVEILEKLVDLSLNTVHPDTTTASPIPSAVEDYIIFPHTYMGVLLSSSGGNTLQELEENFKNVAKEAELATTVSHVQTTPSMPSAVEDYIIFPHTYMGVLLSSSGGNTLQELEENFKNMAKEAELATTVSHVQTTPSMPSAVEDYIIFPHTYMGVLLSSSGGNTLQELEENFKNMAKEAELATKVSHVQTTPSMSSTVEDFVILPHTYMGALLSSSRDDTLQEMGKLLRKMAKEAESATTALHTDIDVEQKRLTSTKPDGEDVVSEVVKVDEATTEQHQIIKKPGVDGTIDDNDDVGIKPAKVTNVETNDLVASKTTNFEGRSFSDNDDPVDPLRTLIEGVELTADITKTIDNFQSFIDPNDSIHFAANQVIETKDDVELVKNAEELNSSEDSMWFATARYIYVAGGVLSIGLTVSLGIVLVLRFRQFKRNILFTC